MTEGEAAKAKWLATWENFRPRLEKYKTPGTYRGPWLAPAGGFFLAALFSLTSSHPGNAPMTVAIMCGFLVWLYDRLNPRSDYEAFTRVLKELDPLLFEATTVATPNKE